MLNSHNDIRFIIIDYGFTRKTVSKHSISNNNVLIPVHLSKYISFNWKSSEIKLYRYIKHRQNGIFKSAMATSHVSDKKADVPTKCRRQMMYLMFTMVHSNMVWILLQIWISWYQCTSYVYNNIQCKQRTDISLKKLMFFRLKGLIWVQVK